MDKKELFINKRYVPKLNIRLPSFTTSSGTVKAFLPTPLSKLTMNDEHIWYRLNSLPEPYRTDLEDVAITLEDLVKYAQKKKTTVKHQSEVYDDGVKVFINNYTQIIPIVGQFLPSDDIPAYTVVNKNGKLALKAILVCIDCHWSELFAGETKYGQNVFCLLSDLTPEQQERVKDYAIHLGEAPQFLQDSEITPRSI